MHGHTLYKNSLNRDRALQREKSKAQRNEHLSMVHKNIKNHNKWNTASETINDNAELERVETSRKEAQKIIDQNIANEAELNKRILAATEIAKQHKSRFTSPKELLKTLRVSMNNAPPIPTSPAPNTPPRMTRVKFDNGTKKNNGTTRLSNSSRSIAAEQSRKNARENAYAGINQTGWSGGKMPTRKVPPMEGRRKTLRKHRNRKTRRHRR